MNFDSFLYNTRPFMNYLFDFYSNLDGRKLSDILRDAKGPENISILVVDMLNGFCKSGQLSSQRVGDIIEPIKNLINISYRMGIKNIIFLNDSHDEHAKEFMSFPKHCVKGTDESNIVDELKEIINGEAVIYEKNSLNPFFGGEYEDGNDFLKVIMEMLKDGKTTFIVVGNCTDLCVYQTAISLKMIGNANNKEVNIIVPSDYVDTYDISVKTAERLKTIPHDGDLLHTIFLYHLYINGIMVIKEILDK